MNPMDPNQFVIPVPPFPGGPDPRFGPYFDGSHVQNPTTNPYLNTLFGMTNAMQDMSFSWGALNSQMAYDPNLAYANGVVNPALANAYSLYNQPMPAAHDQQQGGHGTAPTQEGEKSGPNLGGALKGAAGGAVVGAVVGNLIPIPGVGAGIGAAVGGVIGGLVGLFS